MSQSLITSALAANQELFRGQSLDAWAADQQQRGEKVALFRQYAEGDHRANLTVEMRKLLRIQDSGSLNEFNDNYCDVIIQTMADRLEVTAMTADNDAATEWAADLMAANRFDGLQTDVHEAAIRDADTYVHAYYDEEAGMVRLTHEPAYDGTSGVLIVPGGDGSTQPTLAMKVWRGSVESIGDTFYVNLYFPDRIEKYVSSAGGGLQRREVKGEAWPAPWVGRDRRPLGVPFLHFRNRSSSHDDYGLSELENAIPLQDALNRTLYSMVMAGELTAFQIRWAKGFQPPANLTPGMWITIGKDGLQSDQVADLGVMEQGEIVPFIQQAQWLTSEMGKITRTPAPEFMGSDNASGEALKQREIGLLGKVKRFQVKAGNAWEDVFGYAARVQAAFSNQQPPAFERFTCQWQDAELRSDTETVDNVLKVADRIGERETLRLLAPVFGWDADKIEQIMAEKQSDRSAALASLPLPGFSAATFGVPAGNGNGALAPAQATGV